jgi:two-component system OmpR family response regulator
MEKRTAAVAEDDADTRAVIGALLHDAGFTVHSFACGTDAVAGIRSSHPDLVVLDLGLPDMDGFEVARRIRLFSDVRIIVLTARAGEPDLLMAMETGVDDYVTKPFRPLLLRARIEALMRRPQQATDTKHPLGQEQSGAEAFEHHGLRLSVHTRTVEVNGQEIPLTRSQFELLHALMRAGRRVLTADDLAQVLRERTRPSRPVAGLAATDNVQGHIGRLRQKLGDDPRQPQWVETVHGSGYRMTQSLRRAGRHATTGA